MALFRVACRLFAVVAVRNRLIAKGLVGGLADGGRVLEGMRLLIGDVSRLAVEMHGTQWRECESFGGGEVGDSVSNLGEIQRFLLGKSVELCSVF